MFNITIGHVLGAALMPPCTQVQSNIIAAHMLALHQGCLAAPDEFLVLESDAGSVLRPLSRLNLPKKWCCVNVCPTNTAEPDVIIRAASSPHDFGAVAIVYNKHCICPRLRLLWAQFMSKCEPFDSVIYRLSGAYRTGVMWIEHVYKESSHSDSKYHRIGHVLIEAARTYHRALNSN